MVLLCLFVGYVTSYIVLSHRGVALCKAQEVSGFYFFLPNNSDHWRLTNYGCVYFYYPLIIVDDWIGMGKPDGVGCEPMWKLAK
jgi:hypothetical protein